MNSDEPINLKWISYRQEDDIYKALSNIKYNILGMSLSMYGDDMDNSIPSEIDKLIEFKNFIIKDSRGHSGSNLSVEGTIGMLHKKDKYFIIPPDLIKYIKDNIRSNTIFYNYEENFPQNIEELYRGKELYDILTDIGLPSQAAYALCGMIYAKSKWDPTYIDNYEFLKEWPRRKEGLLAINDWQTKYKIINDLELYRYANFAKPQPFKSVTKYENNYNPKKSGILSMCDLNTWINILKIFIQNPEKNVEDEKTCEEYLTYDKTPRQSNNPEDLDHKLIYTAYLLIEANEYSKTFDSITKKVDKESKKENSDKTNSFITMLLVSRILSQFCCGIPIDELSLTDIFDSFGYLTMMNFDNSFESKTYKGTIIPIKEDKIEKPNAKGITVVNHTEYMKKRTEEIKYIILHYSASRTSGKNNAMSTVRTLDQRALSSDFAIDDDQIIQFADDITKWRSTAVQKWSSSGTIFGKYATNNNSISIEMSSTLGPGGQWVPNDPHFYFTNAVLANTRYLCKILVKEFNIPPQNIIRHYDIMGKACPGIIGWNLARGSDNEDKYHAFVESIYDGNDEEIPEYIKVSSTSDNINNTKPTLPLTPSQNYSFNSSYDKNFLWNG